ncbi:unnamed protein product (macronuclear) [Paramecium tetraurelia]|uniref:BEACH domain-containing protein n=1 Tax=Paramecium tetraurelia TaxID=5888 RepID=A0E6X0_PARTE|nr:uncharacterized protein GSPATT00023765001 [Paramecium tetraurelia]CAK91037.1 unnamed protein product [Paramecium tetraurelia]|eukprot:XP_001458434.1 hypothetical protein (macronuclear) [Paramecium tetraurelia strain d4-2]
MITFTSSKSRFSLYYLEESEKYLQDLSAKVRQINMLKGEERLERGKVHICSRTLIFEPEKQELPIQKLFYRMITTPIKQTNFISFRIKRIIEIFTQGPPSPYIYQDDVDFEIQIEPLFDNVKVVHDLIEKIQQINQQKKDVESEVEKLDSEKLQKARFNMSFVESVSEKPLIQKEMLVRRIMPLIQTKGIMYITNKIIYFQPFFKITLKPCKKIVIEQIKVMYKRRFELLDIGLEIILKSGKTIYYAFENQERMEEVYKVLIGKVTIEAETSLEKIQYLWQSGQISNFEYLMRLNQAGNRSSSDLTQYPVFPLIIVDYESSELNLNDSATFRDLKKPIGALNEKRLQEFKKRYEEMPPPKFLYGTHYSTPGYVIGYLVRQKPQYMLKLQSGKFDKPDRLFKSIKGDFKNVMNNTTSLKELIPEFFIEDDSFLVNTLNLDLGVRQNQKKVGDVKLPKWAKSAKEYLRLNRLALESDYVSNELHHWIDLIFGYKQKGPHSVEANNVFHYLTYEGTVQLSQMQDPIERQASICQINEFGQCPKQLFKIQHPPKCALRAGQIMYKFVEQIPKQKQEEVPINVDGLMWENLDKKNQFRHKMLQKVHKTNITDLIVLEKKNLLVTIGQDGFLKVIDLKELIVLKSFKVDEFCLSCIVTLKQDEIFAIGSWGSQIHVFNINYGSKVQMVQRFNNSVSSLVYLMKKKILVTGSWDCSLKRFECSENQIKQDSEEIIDDWEAQITHIAATEDESMIAVGDIDGRVITINTNNWTQQQHYEINGEKIVKSLFFRASLLVVGDAQIKMFSNGSQLLDFKIDKNNGLITDIIIDHDKYLIACTKKGYVAVFSMVLESKLGYLFTDFSGQADLIGNQDQQFTKMILRNKTLILTSQNGSLNVLQY